MTAVSGVQCWGDNAYGQLGDGTSGNIRTTLVGVVGLTRGVTAVSAGNRHTCVVTTANGVKCWGNNYYGQLGDGTSGEIRTTPVDVVGLADGVFGISAGVSYTCAVTTSSGVKCWGSDRHGQLGD